MKDKFKTFKLGDLVRKKSGSDWCGYIVGWYSTDLTEEGYCVESCHHNNSVQIYPAKALILVATAEEDLKNFMNALGDLGKSNYGGTTNV